LRADTELLLQRCPQHAGVLVTGLFSQQGPLYGIGCLNPSGLPITFHHLKASLKHIYFFNATAILGHIKKIGDRPFDFTNQGRGRFFLKLFDDPKIKPVYTLEPCKQVYRVHPQGGNGKSRSWSKTRRSPS
jgi:hypothetical protein